MRVLFRTTTALLEAVRENLLEPHAFAAERVGFLSCKAGRLKPSGLILLAFDHHPVADGDYVNDPTVGAMMGPEAIRKALQFAYNNEVGMFHVHLHDHTGRPRPSRTDLRETARFIPDFWHVSPQLPHGAVIISRDSVSGRCWYPGSAKPISITEVSIVGQRLTFVRN